MRAVAEEVMTNEARSGRALSHMDPEVRLVHLRLEEWAHWAKDAGIAGYPHQSVTERAATYGRLGIPQEPLHKPEPAMPDRVAVIDAAICRLGDIDRGVIRSYYTQWCPLEAMARRHHMRVAQFQRVLQRARWRIIGFIDGRG